MQGTGHRITANAQEASGQRADSLVGVVFALEVHPLTELLEAVELECSSASSDKALQ